MLRPGIWEYPIIAKEVVKRSKLASVQPMRSGRVSIKNLLKSAKANGGQINDVPRTEETLKEITRFYASYGKKQNWADW